MRRNRVIAETSAFLLAVTGLLALSSGGGNTANGVPPPTTTLAAPPPPSPKAASPGREVRIAAVGDMNGPRTYAPNSRSGRNGAAITRLVRNNEIDAFLGLGDFQYATAYCADYVKYWTRLWGGTKPKLYWVSAPNHDWKPGRGSDRLQ